MTKLNHCLVMVRVLIKVDVLELLTLVVQVSHRGLALLATVLTVYCDAHILLTISFPLSEPDEGFETSTPALQEQCSSSELIRQMWVM